MRREVVMFKTIVWATDGSEPASAALPYARSLVAEDGRIVAVHCKELFEWGRVAGQPVLADEEDLEAAILRELAELRGAGEPIELMIVPGTAGHAAQVVADRARDLGADIIVVGTRGHSPVAGVLVGSVTQRLLHLATCPVLAVPAQTVLAAELAEQHVATAKESYDRRCRA
jgi:nucleotide-binding universal stress UspA family protein